MLFQGRMLRSGIGMLLASCGRCLSRRWIWWFDIAISDIQLRKLLEYRMLDIGYCSTNVLNLGNWDIVTHRV